MKKILFLFGMLVSLQLAMSQSSFYDFKVKTIDGHDFSFLALKGKKVLVVNTASKCGLTPQYEKLEALFKKYGGEQFVIIGFPANNFNGQEPGTNSEIREFCSTRFGVSFPMMEKISVKGDDMHPLYRWLIQLAKEKSLDGDVKWNFQKFLINEDGTLFNVISPKTSPDDITIISWIESGRK